jgi:lysozyme
MPTLNQAGLDLIEQFEGDELHAYADMGGVETIGYGHTGGVTVGETITQAQAVQYLKGDVDSALKAVDACIAINLTDNEFAALVSFEYNTGSLAGSPGLALINAKQFEPAWDDHFCLWVHDAAGNVDPGLVRRRTAEKALFFTHD